MANKGYCLKCKKMVDFKHNENHTVITRVLKNGMTTNILCGECIKCDGKVCSILGNQKSAYKAVKTKK